MRSHLCNRCGSCVGGLSEGKIVFEDKTGEYRPKVIGAIDDDHANTLWEACPGKQFDFSKYREVFYKDVAHFHEFIGPYERIGIGFAKDAEIRSEGASGGIISAILIYLLEQKKIDGAVVLGMSKSEPWLTQLLLLPRPNRFCRLLKVNISSVLIMIFYPKLLLSKANWHM